MSCHTGKDAHILLGGIRHYQMLESTNLRLCFCFEIHLAYKIFLVHVLLSFELYNFVTFKNSTENKVTSPPMKLFIIC